MTTSSRRPQSPFSRRSPSSTRTTPTPSVSPARHAVILSMRLAAITAILAAAAACRPAPGADNDAIGPAVVAGQGAGAAAQRTPRGQGADTQAADRAAAPHEPGRGVVAGRLIDSATGLPVPDVQVQLVETGRRTLTGASGTFRFDGVPAGDMTVAFGPSDTHVIASRSANVGEAGFDFGLVPLLAADAPTYIVPELGGVAPGCGRTEAAVPAGALDAPAALRVTCLPDEKAFPVPAPPGRLPLAVVDLAPGDRVLSVPVTITLALPTQPRFAAGVALELLQLDVRRLKWDPVGVATVDAGGETASGSVGALAPVMVVAPPFGSAGAAGDTPPTVARYNVAAAPDGVPSDIFDGRTILVYAGFDYAGMANTTVRVKTTDARGATLFESARPYTDAGRDNVPMIAQGGEPWPIGDYRTTWSIGEPPVAVGKAVAWSVTERPTPGPTAIALVIAPALAREGVSFEAPYGSDGLPPRAVPVGAADCGRPPGWVEYTVQPGDTLSLLAQRSTVDVATLMRANCLASDAIFAGRLLYLARFPSKPYTQGAWPPPYPVKPGSGWPEPLPTRTVPSGGGVPMWPTKGPGLPPTLAPLPYPTTWYTPPPPQYEPTPGGPAQPVPGVGASGGGASGGPGIGGRQPEPQPFVPPSAPTRIPPKDPSPAEPTLAPRPNP
ncbi:MAG: LysM peptidoglycan-binding domain-containing protein [Ardenticatenales bacterium]|nr:LysM peptidoglycan-binding domain-containing protein [Ardenticatenales bacterium]